MGYNYSIDFSPFKVEDFEVFKKQLQDNCHQYLADCFVLSGDKVYFECDDRYGKWRGEEEKIIDLIIDNLIPRDYCIFTWEGEDFCRGGELITNIDRYKICYEPYITLSNKRSLHLEEAIIVAEQYEI